MNGLDELREHGRMTWLEAEEGNTRTGAVASAIWVTRLLGPQATVFITVDGESLRGNVSNPEIDPHREDGGEG